MLGFEASLMLLEVVGNEILGDIGDEEGEAHHSTSVFCGVRRITRLFSRSDLRLMAEDC
jgi:hypothetical protein